MMTFRMAPPSCTAPATAPMSATSASRSPARAAAMSMTMSTSSAPSATAPAASATLTAVVVGASGNPATAQVSTPLPARASCTVVTQTGLTQTLFTFASVASAQRSRMSWREACGLSRVWSMYSVTIMVSRRLSEGLGHGPLQLPQGGGGLRADPGRLRGGVDRADHLQVALELWLGPGGADDHPGVVRGGVHQASIAGGCR